MSRTILAQHCGRNHSHPEMPTNYLWRKLTTTSWLDEREQSLREKTGGDHAVIERPGRDRVQIECFCEHLRIARELRVAFGGSVRKLPSDWQTQLFAAAKIKPLRLGKRLTIVSDATDLAAPSPAESFLLIPSGAAFGTGAHATTAMSLRMLERVARKFPDGWCMFDAGTGSGILALTAWRFGARRILAIDNDPTAIATAKQNARANRISGVQFAVADVGLALRGQFDIITANLYSELLIKTLPKFRQSLARDGRLILSGVLRQQETELVHSLQANRFRIQETRRRGKWIALVAQQARQKAVDAKDA